MFTRRLFYFFDILPTPKGGGFCYHQPMLKNLSLTRSPARVDAPTLFICYYRIYSKIKVQNWQDAFCAVSSPQLKQGLSRRFSVKLKKIDNFSYIKEIGS